MIGWIAVTLSLIGIILNAKKKMLCWPVWILSNILWIIIMYKNLPQLILWLTFIIFNVYGWRQWKKLR